MVDESDTLSSERRCSHAHDAVSTTSETQELNHMEAIIVLAIIASLVIFDIMAIRYGADSRITDKTRPNW